MKRCGAFRGFTLTDGLCGAEYPDNFGLPHLDNRGSMIAASARSTTFLFILSAFMAPVIASAQTRPDPQATAIAGNAVASPFSDGNFERAAIRQSSFKSVCHDASADSAAIAALRLVCQRPIAEGAAAAAQAIVIGFLGGFANADDLKHPEVLFAAYLREHYSPAVHAQVFANHNEQGALEYVTQLLDRDHDGLLSDAERRSARIIIYGHSWGASQTAAFARELGRRGIPVLLTVQLDIIRKPGQEPVLISPNVASAVNFYQSRGPLEGRPRIVASDPARTTIIGNFKITDPHVNCDNFPWFVRTFNKPHHEIENDAHVWDKIASLIDAEVADNDQPKKSAADIAPRIGEAVTPPQPLF
jgi:hypothetical protein